MDVLKSCNVLDKGVDPKYGSSIFKTREHECNIIQTVQTPQLVNIAIKPPVQNHHA